MVLLNWIASNENITNGGVILEEGETIFTIEIEVLNNNVLSNVEIFDDASRNKMVYNDFSNIKYLEVDFQNIITVPVQEFEKFTFNISPNPANDIVYIDSNIELINPEFFIYNLSGKLIKQGDLNSNAINVESFENGLYFIFIQDQGYEFNQKLVIVD